MWLYTARLMLMVVFGAGASHDSIDVKPPNRGHRGWVIEEQFRPPLANDLFGSTELFANAIARFERLQPIVPFLRHPGGKSVETVLRELQDEAAVYPERHCQLMAVRYYLHYALCELEVRWKAASKNVTNYKALLDQINRWRKPDEVVSLVTFNYDTLLEDAMPSVGLTISDLSGYVHRGHPYKVFKLHGSVNWARAVRSGSPYSSSEYASVDAWSVAQTNIERAASLIIGDTFTVVHEHPVGLFKGSPNDKVGLVPAIAIPVEKKASFECPQPHLDLLKELLPDVDRLLLIGWRAREDHFLALLQAHLKGPLLVQVVAGTESEASGIASGLQGGPFSKLEVKWEYAPAGFTDFIVNQRAVTILSR
jgi:hypothetical protein